MSSLLILCASTEQKCVYVDFDRDAWYDGSAFYKHFMYCGIIFCLSAYVLIFVVKRFDSWTNIFVILWILRTFFFSENASRESMRNMFEWNSIKIQTMCYRWLCEYPMRNVHKHWIWFSMGNVYIFLFLKINVFKIGILQFLHLYSIGKCF